MNCMLKIRRIFPGLALVLCITSLVTGCSKIKSYRANSALSKAEEQYAAENYAAAEINYQKVLKLKPHHPVPIRRLGLIYFKNGRILQAGALLNRALELDPESAEARAALGSLYLMFRDFTGAAAQANLVLSKQPTNEEGVLLLAESVTSSNELAQVVQQINTLIQVYGDLAVYRVALGTLALKVDQVTNATAELDKAYQTSPKSPAVLSALGKLARLNRDEKQAGEFFKAAADLSPARSLRRLDYAWFLFNSGNANQATDYLRELTKRVPDYIAGYLTLAQMYLSTKNFAESEKVVKSILLRDDSNYDALMMAGNLRLAQNDAQGAVQVFSRALSLYEKSPQISSQILIRLAQAQAFNGESIKAAGSLRRVIRSDTNQINVEASLMLARLDLQKGDFAAAISSLNQVITNQPPVAPAYLLLADAHLSRENYQEALKVYRKLAQLFPKSPEVYFHTAAVLVRDRKLAQARAAAAKAIELAPDFLPPSELLIRLDMQDGNFTAAHERAARLIEAQPQAAEPRLIQANIYLAETNVAQAESALLKAIEISPDANQAYIMLADSYLRSGRKADALAKLSALVAKTNDITGYLLIGFIQDGQQNFPAAKDAYEKVLQLNPKSSPALNNLAYLYAERLNQPDKALPLAESARQLMPYSPAAADTLGWVLYRKGDYARALGLLQEAASKAPEAADIQFHSGMVSYIMGEEAAARMNFSRVLQSTNNAADISEAKARLAYLDINPESISMEALQEKLTKQPSDPILLLRLAAVYQRERAYTKAAETYEVLLKLLPQNARVKIKLAQLYSGPLKNDKVALELAKAAHSLLPGDAEIMETLGRLVLDAGDTAWAASLLQDVARGSPDDLALEYSLAWALYLTGDTRGATTAMSLAAMAPATAPFLSDAQQFIVLTGAVADLERTKSLQSRIVEVLKTNAVYVPALMLSAKLQSANGHADQAAKTYNFILAKYPAFTPAGRELVILASGDTSPDPKIFDLGLKARSAYPNDPALARALGLLCFRRNDFARTVLYLQESTLISSEDAEALFYLGSAQFQQRSFKEAKANLERALTLAKLPPSLSAAARKLVAEIK